MEHKFKVGDKYRVIKGTQELKKFEGQIGIVSEVSDGYDSNYWCKLRFDSKYSYAVNTKYSDDELELVEEEKCEPCEVENDGIRMNYLSNSFEIPQNYLCREIKKAEIVNKNYLTLGQLYGYKVYLSKKEMYTYESMLKNGLIGELAGYTYEDYKPKKTIMSKITTFAKNLVLSADEKLLRKYGLHDECGNHTDEAEDLVIAKLVKENEAYLIELAKGMEAEEKSK